jgi:hypothetical protein
LRLLGESQPAGFNKQQRPDKSALAFVIGEKRRQFEIDIAGSEWRSQRLRIIFPGEYLAGAMADPSGLP